MLPDRERLKTVLCLMTTFYQITKRNVETINASYVESFIPPISTMYPVEHPQTEKHSTLVCSYVSCLSMLKHSRNHSFMYSWYALTYTPHTVRDGLEKLVSFFTCLSSWTIISLIACKGMLLLDAVSAFRDTMSNAPKGMTT